MGSESPLRERTRGNVWLQLTILCCLSTFKMRIERSKWVRSLSFKLKLTGGVESHAAAACGRWRVDWLVLVWLTLNSDLPIATAFDKFNSIYSSFLLHLCLCVEVSSNNVECWRVSCPKLAFERGGSYLYTVLGFRIVRRNTHTRIYCSRMICSNQICRAQFILKRSGNASSTVGGSSFKHRISSLQTRFTIPSQW